MRLATLLVVTVVAACHARTGDRAAADSLDLAGLAPRDSADSVLRTPRVVTRPAVIVFWLVAGDTLHPDDAAAAFDELTLATEGIVPALAAYDIQLLPTNADTVYVELPNRRRQSILLSGLEFPFGFVLVEPGGVERILSGVYSEEDLLEELRAYFDLPDDSTSAQPKITT